MVLPQTYTVGKVSKNGVFFWSVFSGIQSECVKIRTRKNSVFGNFSRSGWLCGNPAGNDLFKVNNNDVRR